MKKSIILILLPLLIACHKEQVYLNPCELLDGNPTTSFTGQSGTNRILFDEDFSYPIQSYKIYSGGNLPSYDPAKWTLKGSYDGKTWVTLDEQKEQSFCSRFQEAIYTIKNPSNYKQYLIEIQTASKDSVLIGDILFFENNLLIDWEDFSYPKINYEVLSPAAKGASVYRELVQDPEEYIRYHTQKVAEILYDTASDSIQDVKTINFQLEEYDGISGKWGNPPSISIVYSTKHIERSAEASLWKLDNETRGVLYHELVHAYQYEPKGIGSYSTNKEFWACIEGLADAVRAEAGLFDMNTRKPGGHWLDGYRTTGFFLQWLTMKDPNAIRKFHKTVSTLPVWSFDKAMKELFGPANGIAVMWNEYQVFLERENANKY